MANRARTSGDGESSEEEETLQAALHQQISYPRGENHGGESSAHSQQLPSDRNKVDRPVASKPAFHDRGKNAKATSSGEVSKSVGDEVGGDARAQQTSLTASGASAPAQPVSNVSQVAIKILVSNNASGSIIGRSGKTISELQLKSMSRIKLSQSGDYYPGTSDRVCLIQGTLPNASVAIEMVLRRLYELQIYQQTHLPFTHVSDPNKPGVGGSVSVPFIVRLLVPTPSCGMLIGRGGANIKSLKESTGVSYIQLSPKEKEASISGAPSATAAILLSTSERIMTITGPDLSSCVKCIIAILGNMASNPEICHYINMTTSYTKAVSAAQSSLGIFPRGIPSHRQQSEQSAPIQQQLSPHPNIQQTYDSGKFAALPFPGELPLQEDPHSSVASQHKEHPYSRSNIDGQPYAPPFISGSMPSVVLPIPTFDHHRIPPPSQLNADFPSSHATASSVPAIFPQYQDPSIVGQPTQQWSPLSSAGSGTSPPLQPQTAGALLPVEQLTQQFTEQVRTQEPSTAQPQAITSSQSVTLQIGIPDAIIGSILGRGGKTLTEVQALSKTRIKISQRGEFIPGTKNRAVTVVGPDTQSVATAQYLINQRLSTSVLRSSTSSSAKGKQG